MERERGIPCVSNHARERALERLGVAPTREQWVQAVLDILDRRALCITRNGDGSREVYEIIIGGSPLRVVWLPDRALLVTVLAPDMSGAHYAARQAREAAIRPMIVLKPCYRRGKRLRSKRLMEDA